MRIGSRKLDDKAEVPSPPLGPWSEPPDDAPRKRFASVAQPWLKHRRGAREPIIGNWKGLVAILFLLLVAPPLARIASGIIMGLIHGR